MHHLTVILKEQIAQPSKVWKILPHFHLISCGKLGETCLVSSPYFYMFAKWCILGWAVGFWKTETRKCTSSFLFFFWKKKISISLSIGLIKKVSLLGISMSCTALLYQFLTIVLMINHCLHVQKSFSSTSTSVWLDLLGLISGVMFTVF